MGVCLGGLLPSISDYTHAAALRRLNSRSLLFAVSNEISFIRADVALRYGVDHGIVAVYIAAQCSANFTRCRRRRWRLACDALPLIPLPPLPPPRPSSREKDSQSATYSAEIVWHNGVLAPQTVVEYDDKEL